MKKLLVLILAASMAFSLCACGNNSGASTALDDYTALPANSDPNSAIPDDPTETIEPNTTSDPASGAEDTQIPDLASTISNQPEGLIILTTSSGNTIGTTNIVISSINIDTGDFQTISSFTLGDIRDGNTVLGCYVTPEGSGYVVGGGYYTTRREWFDDDYDRMAVTWVDSMSAEVHAGWVDTDGEFFDVTVALGLEAKSDFDSPTKHNAVGFSEDGYFIYRNLVGDGPDAYWEFYHVPLNNLTAGAVEPGIWLPGAGEDFQYQNRDLRFSDYDSSSGRFLLNTPEIISYLYDNVNGTGETYVPGDSRLSWNGVFSPDGTSVAFMSKPNKGGVVDIYIMSFVGGDPIKVDTGNVDLATYEDCARGYYTTGTPCSMLISWE